MKHWILLLSLFSAQAYSQSQTLGGLGATNSQNGLGPTAKFSVTSPGTILSARLSNMVTGTENGKSFLEYDLEVNTRVFSIGSLPITLGAQTSNRFFKNEHLFMAGADVVNQPTLNINTQAGLGMIDFNSRFGGETEVEIGSRELKAGESYTSEEPIQDIDDVQEVIDSNPELFTDKTYNVPLKAIIGENLQNVPTVKITGRYVPIIGSLFLSGKLGLGHSSYKLNVAPYVIQSSENTNEYSGLAVASPPISYSYTRINPGLTVTKSIGSKFRIWLDAEYNYDQLKINAKKVGEKLQRSNGVISLGVALKLNK